ncbi:hypothetical protein GXW82_40060 [Streptacidiphilus sp. 4-A2]|nr:hypothetical protein [Streptacidiphilus sp. 4-A2]
MRAFDGWARARKRYSDVTGRRAERQVGDRDGREAYPPAPQAIPQGRFRRCPLRPRQPGPGPAAAGRPGRPEWSERPQWSGFDLPGWLAAPRHTGTAGVYGLGPAPRAKQEQEDAATVAPAWKLLLRALLNLVVAWEVFYYLGSLVGVEVHNLLQPYVGDGFGLSLTTWLVDLAEIALLARIFGGMGRWPLVWRRYGLPLARRIGGTGEGRVSIPAQGPRSRRRWIPGGSSGHWRTRRIWRWWTRRPRRAGWQTWTTSG